MKGRESVNRESNKKMERKREYKKIAKKNGNC